MKSNFKLCGGATVLSTLEITARDSTWNQISNVFIEFMTIKNLKINNLDFNMNKAHFLFH